MYQPSWLGCSNNLSIVVRSYFLAKFGVFCEFSNYAYECSPEVEVII